MRIDNGEVPGVIRERSHARKRLNVWVPIPVHDALVKWLAERDQTIQGTVRRLLEAEIEYDGPPDDVPVTPRAASVDTWRSEPKQAARPEPVRLTVEEADRQYLECRRRGYDSGKARRAVMWAPLDWEPVYFEGDPVPSPAQTKRFCSAWTTEQAFEYWVRKGEMARSAWERAGGEGEPPEPDAEWVEAGRRSLEGEI